MRQILENRPEYGISTFHLFIDFKAAYSAIRRNKLLLFISYLFTYLSYLFSHSLTYLLYLLAYFSCLLTYFSYLLTHSLTYFT